MLGMPNFLRYSLLVTIAALVAVCSSVWVLQVQAQAPVQIGANSPLPVFVTNPLSDRFLPEGFVQGSRWRFTTWTVPSVITWVGTVNRTSGAWANLTITAEGRPGTTIWVYVPNMPGSWERQ
jgi:hypothetical protein